MVFVDFDHVDLVVSLEVDLAEVVLVEEVVGDDQPLVVVGESNRVRAASKPRPTIPVWTGRSGSLTSSMPT